MQRASHFSPHAPIQEHAEDLETASDQPERATHGVSSLPTYNDKTHLTDHDQGPGLAGPQASGTPAGDGANESGRRGFHPIRFLCVCFKSTCTLSMLVNILWPFVPPAIVLHFARPDLHLWIFILNYIAMVPSANLLGFAGGELAKKLPKVLGVLLETTLSSVVEIVLFMVLIRSDNFPVIRAAILGSILANLLLCLGLCFFFGGLKRQEQAFHEAVSEVGSGLLLVAGFGLMIPSAYYAALSNSSNMQTTSGAVSAVATKVHITPERLAQSTLVISRATSVILLVAFLM